MEESSITRELSNSRETHPPVTAGTSELLAAARTSPTAGSSAAKTTWTLLTDNVARNIFNIKLSRDTNSGRSINKRRVDSSSRDNKIVMDSTLKGNRLSKDVKSNSDVKNSGEATLETSATAGTGRQSSKNIGSSSDYSSSRNNRNITDSITDENIIKIWKIRFKRH
jgi:hypothetical protein